MASTSPQTLASAIEDIRGAGLFLLKDGESTDPQLRESANKGKEFDAFLNAGYPTKTPMGIDFIIRNTLDDPVIGEIVRNLIPGPRWGYLRLFSDKLPQDHAWFFHIRDPNQDTEPLQALIVQFWLPGSQIVYYEGAQKHSFSGRDVDRWGILGTPTLNMRKETVHERIVTMPEGGCTILDSRLGWTCQKGTFLNIAFGPNEEARKWRPMGLPDTPSLRQKVKELEDRGVYLNVSFDESVFKHLEHIS